MVILYTQDKEVYHFANRKLGPPAASYYKTWLDGGWKGSHWLTNRTFARKVGKQFGKGKIEVLER